MNDSPATQVSWSCDGLQPGWALLLAMILIAGTWWSYRVFTPDLSQGRRIALAVLRSLLFAGLVFVLTRPVLLLSTNEPIRGSLLVLLDSSESMNIADKREDAMDQKRAAIALGSDEPASASLSRWDLLQKLAANPKLALWPRLHEKAELVIYSLGRGARELGTLAPVSGNKLTTGESAAYFSGLKAGEPATALGSGLQEILDQRRGQAISGVLLITDGANNSGIPPLQAAMLGETDRVPLYIYGVGVSQPLDIIVSNLEGPATSRMKERVEFTAKVRGLSLSGRKATVVLKANGQKVDEKTIEFSGDSTQEVTLGYEPEKMEDVQLEASVAPQGGEVTTENNAATAKLRVTDDKIKVLVIEQEPRWDFEYLVAMLQRDRRLETKIILIDGDPSLRDDPNFLPGLPEDKTVFFDNKIIILGDVDPARFGEVRMKMLAEWVGEMGGGLVFHAGPKFNPRAYRTTPLAPLLPVEPIASSGAESVRPMEFFPLNLTDTGKMSPVLKLSDDPDENLTLWRKFPGVRWAAPIERARPAAEVLLTRGGGNSPVIAVQNYGAGQTLFVGTDETYRWRSKTGEKSYSQLWGQMLQLLASGQGGGLVRLQVERPQYAAGEKIVISGKLFRSGYAPLTDETVPGTLIIESAAAGPAQKTDMTLRAIPGRPGEYRAETLATEPGRYRFITALDAKSAVQWDVSKLNLEQSETAMNETLLRDMAAKGHFLREENLDDLPGMVAASSASTPVLKKIDLAFSGWVLAALLALAVAEWTIRRLSELK